MDKNGLFGLLRKIESLVFARNGLKRSILWLAKALDQSDHSIFQITISFEPFNRFLYFFA